MQTFLEAIAAVPPGTIAKYAAIGAAAGGIVTPLIIFLAIKTNYRRLRDAYAHIPQSRGLYRLFAIAGAAVFAIIVGSQPVLDAMGENEIYLRGALIPVIAIGVGIPFVRRLKVLRDAG